MDNIYISKGKFKRCRHRSFSQNRYSSEFISIEYFLFKMNKNIRTLDDIPEDAVILFANANESAIVSNTLRIQLKKIESKLHVSSNQPRSKTRSLPLVILFVFESGGKTDGGLQFAKKPLEVIKCFCN